MKIDNSSKPRVPQVFSFREWIFPLNKQFPETELNNSHVSCQPDSVLNDQKTTDYQKCSQSLLLDAAVDFLVSSWKFLKFEMKIDKGLVIYRLGSHQEAFYSHPLFFFLFSYILYCRFRPFETLRIYSYPTKVLKKSSHPLKLATSSALVEKKGWHPLHLYSYSLVSTCVKVLDTRRKILHRLFLTQVEIACAVFWFAA